MPRATLFASLAAFLLTVEAAPVELLRAGPPGPADDTPAVESIYLARLGDTLYSFPVTRDLLDRSPPWLPRDPHPPLSGRTALAKASAVADCLLREYRRTKCPAERERLRLDQWGLVGMQLTTTGYRDRWLWVVRYECRPLAAGERVLHLEIPVLMDGTVVRPGHTPKEQCRPKRRPPKGP